MMFQVSHVSMHYRDSDEASECDVKNRVCGGQLSHSHWWKSMDCLSVNVTMAYDPYPFPSLYDWSCILVDADKRLIEHAYLRILTYWLKYILRDSDETYHTYLGTLITKWLHTHIGRTTRGRLSIHTWRLIRLIAYTQRGITKGRLSIHTLGLWSQSDRIHILGDYKRQTVSIHTWGLWSQWLHTHTGRLWQEGDWA